MKIKILAWLLHHANRSTRDKHFYEVKNRILSMYGKTIGYDVQHFKAKTCHSCDGSGMYSYKNPCYHCGGTGDYKPETWVFLQRLQLGRYIFHKPYQRVYSKPELGASPIIEGYIEHSKTPYGLFAITLLMLHYDRSSYWHKGVNQMDCGWPWRTYWYYPRNWWRTVMHIITRRHNSQPAKAAWRLLIMLSPVYLWHSIYRWAISLGQPKPENTPDDLPF